MDTLDGSCYRSIREIGDHEYKKMPMGMLQIALVKMRKAMGVVRPHDGTHKMKKPALLAEVLERLVQLPETCETQIDVGKRFDPSSRPVTFSHFGVGVEEAIREWNLPDPALDLIVDNLRRISPGIVMVCGGNGWNCRSVRFARPTHMTASGVCTLQELGRVPIGPDVLYPSGERYNEFTPGEPTGMTQCIRYIGDGSWYETPARPHGDCIWIAWNGKNVLLRFFT